MKALVFGATAAVIAAGSAFAQDQNIVIREQMVAPALAQQAALIESRAAAAAAPRTYRYAWYGQYIKGEWRPGWVAVR